MLRRRKSDAPFLRENLVAALNDGAACEVDIAFTADGHALCLHDPTLDRETTGRGLVAATARSQIERVLQRGSDGRNWLRLDCHQQCFVDHDHGRWQRQW